MGTGSNWINDSSWFHWSKLGHGEHLYYSFQSTWWKENWTHINYFSLCHVKKVTSGSLFISDFNVVDVKRWATKRVRKTDFSLFHGAKLGHDSSLVHFKEFTTHNSFITECSLFHWNLSMTTRRIFINECSLFQVKQFTTGSIFKRNMGAVHFMSKKFTTGSIFKTGCSLVLVQKGDHAVPCNLKLTDGN